MNKTTKEFVIKICNSPFFYYAVIYLYGIFQEGNFSKNKECFLPTRYYFLVGKTNCVRYSFCRRTIIFQDKTILVDLEILFCSKIVG